mgnify:CR=1 FL=1
MIRPEAIGEEYVEIYEAAKDSAADAPRRPGPRRGASADATELCLRRGGSPDADETTPSLVPKIEVPVRRNWIEGATFAQSIRNRSSIAAAGIAAAATSVNSVFIREENDIIHGHTPREGISRPIYL